MHNEPAWLALLERIAAICREAVERHGDDWLAIEAFIQARLRLLPDSERGRLTEAIGQILRYTPPQGPSALSQ